ncbi:hypothetical protein [Aequorivita marina]|uniref:hypothetical protein n=1 Tax=Aequorivita marina TaxID=3073654 RepID=UPI0028764235|nr:hypothetical protein [Aequorivita sp. S2608]MDS1297739.1 hypothetical protein [Aequorivita sp. S2608]
MGLQASQKAFISHYIKLDFFNDSKLDADIQNRISDESEINFQIALGNIQGDNKDSKGTNFSELTLLAMAYFYERIFPKNAISDAVYTVEGVKGFFDACNLTNYTAIYEIDTTYYKLKDTALFNACYLVIQSAWFFNSEHFGRHQHITYVNHYAQYQKKLPESQYRYDIEYLHKKYKEVDEKEIKGVYGFKMVERWHYLILFLICKELDLPTNHFKISEKRFREYNPLVKCSRMLRGITPFKIVDCDIKSAFPSFIDFAINADKRHKVYSTLQENHNISRSEAKVLFNKWCNSGKYKTVLQTKNFLISCGYSESECTIITGLTHSKNPLFYDFMCEYEKRYIDLFMNENAYLKGGRLHDGVIFIDKKTKPIQSIFDDKCVFGFDELNKPIYSNTFGYSNKRLSFAYISSVPPTTKENYMPMVRKQILTYPKAIGDATGFRFYAEKYEYISASFNIVERCSFDDFVNNCIEMISTLHYLNGEPISKMQLFLILSHIRQNSNVIFNLRYLFRELVKHLHRKDDIMIQSRDFETIENLKFRKRIDFLNALNNARGTVNKKLRMKQLFQMLKTRFTNGNFSFIEFKMNGKAKTNEFIKCIILRINELTTGRKRKPYAQTDKNYPLYSNMYKEGVSYVVEHHKKANTTRLAQRKIQVYERELLKINRLINNREIALQYIFILGEVVGVHPDVSIKRDNSIIEAEKAYLMEQYSGSDYKTIKQGAKAFNREYVPKTPKEIEGHIPKLEDFNTSLEHSAFNIEIEQAHNRGEQFFQEYLRFHKIDLSQKEVKEVKNKKIEVVFPKIDFDEWD